MEELLEDLDFEFLPRHSVFTKVLNASISRAADGYFRNQLNAYTDYITQTPTKKLCIGFEVLILPSKVKISDKESDGNIYFFLKQFLTIESFINQGGKLKLKKL